MTADQLADAEPEAIETEATEPRATEPETAADGATARPRPIEVELKYRPATLEAAERVLHADAIAGLAPWRPPRSMAFEDRYLDTPDGALAAAGYAARLRTTPDGTIVSIKSTAKKSGNGALHRREELEAPAMPGAPPRDWPESDARSLLLEICGDQPLAELVTIRQLRRRRRLRDDGTVLEISLDDVAVESGGALIDRWVELEVEVVKGDETRLTAVAEELERDPELVPGDGSKLDRALAALRAPRSVGSLPAGLSPATTSRAPRAAEPKTPGVTGDDTVTEAGRKTLRFHFARMLAREAGTRDGSDLEDLHAMHVATRRMRAAWRIFGDGFAGGGTRKLQRRLRDIARRLGDVRDLDVLLDGLETYRADLPGGERRAMQPLVDAWQGSRDEARGRLLQALDSEDYLRFVDEFRVFVHTEGAAAAEVVASRPHHVRDTAPSRIWAAYEQVRAYEPVLRWADVEALHELRIAAKWLRYSMEFVKEPLGPDVDALVPRVTALQDHLGWLHDADVAAGLTRTFLLERAGSLSTAESAAIARYLVSREREIARLRRTIGRPWRGVAGLAFRRQLGRAVAQL